MHHRLSQIRACLSGTSDLLVVVTSCQLASAVPTGGVTGCRPHISQPCRGHWPVLQAAVWLPIMHAGLIWGPLCFCRGGYHNATSKDSCGQLNDITALQQEFDAAAGFCRRRCVRVLSASQPPSRSDDCLPTWMAKLTRRSHMYFRP